MAYTSKDLTPNSDIDMVIDPADNLFDIGNSYENDRGCFLSLSMYRPRSPSISSSKCSEEYYIYVKKASDRMDENEPVGFIDSIKLEYVSYRGQKDQVSKVTNIANNMLQQCVPNKDQAPNLLPSNNMFNINLNNDIDQALDLEEWDSKFYTTSLHGAIKHLASNVKNIKDSLQRMGKYIRVKAIDNNPNRCKDLKGIDKALWEFLSSIYNSH